MLGADDVLAQQFSLFWDGLELEDADDEPDQEEEAKGEHSQQGCLHRSGGGDRSERAGTGVRRHAFSCLKHSPRTIENV